jgi:hypothetical protein
MSGRAEGIDDRPSLVHAEAFPFRRKPGSSARRGEDPIKLQPRVLAGVERDCRARLRADAGQHCDHGSGAGWAEQEAEKYVCRFRKLDLKALRGKTRPG